MQGALLIFYIFIPQSHFSNWVELKKNKAEYVQVQSLYFIYLNICTSIYNRGEKEILWIFFHGNIFLSRQCKVSSTIYYNLQNVRTVWPCISIIKYSSHLTRMSKDAVETLKNKHKHLGLSLEVLVDNKSFQSK